MLSQSAAYAASALAFITAMGGKPVQVRAVSAACEIPAAYLAKIVNVLARRGLVTTQRGVGGGVALARAPQELFLRDLCIALDDPLVRPRCMLGNAACTEDRSCPAHEFCGNYRGKLAQFLATTSIADIASFEAKRRWRAAASQEKESA